MSDIFKPRAAPPAPLPRWAMVVTARPAAGQALGVSVATAAAVFAPITAPVAPVLYALCALRLRLVRL